MCPVAQPTCRSNPSAHRSHKVIHVLGIQAETELLDGLRSLLPATTSMKPFWMEPAMARRGGPGMGGLPAQARRLAALRGLDGVGDD